MDKQRLEQIAKPLVGKSFDEIEEVAKELGISPITLFLTVIEIEVEMMYSSDMREEVASNDSEAALED